MFNIDVENFIIGGDWNILLYVIDKKGGNFWKLIVFRDLLMIMMKEFDLVDVYREKNLINKSYIYELKVFKFCLCIDFFLIL